MKKIKDPMLFRLIKNFLGTYLPSIRQRSKNTVDSHRDALNVYLLFIQKNKGKHLSDVVVADFNQTDLAAFTKWLSDKRQNKPSTINQRLSHLRNFSEYLYKNGEISFSDLNDILEVERIKDSQVSGLVYLSIEDMKLVLAQPNTAKKTGVRDKFFIALLYDSGCRVQEVLDLKLKDFVFKRNNREAELRIIGKGQKYRVTPVTRDVVKLFDSYCRMYHPDSNSNDYLFYTVRQRVVTQMSSDNVQRFLKVYEKRAKELQPDLPHLHAHLFRHTRAMHLYMAGVPLPLVAEWLGHSNMETTQIYAQATVDMKRKAAEKLMGNGNSVFDKDVTFKYADDDEVLKKLSGLK